MDGRREIGRRGEDVAAAFVMGLGWRVVVRNFRCRAGEIDVVAIDGDTVVFVEVRTRAGEWIAVVQLYRSLGGGWDAADERAMAGAK